MLAFHGKLYRVLNPVWARDPLSGEGAARFGGRFNPVGTPALYCSLSPVTALREANQVGDLQPTVLVCYRAAIPQVFDGRESDALNAYGMASAALGDAGWRDARRRSGIPTQTFARRLIAVGFNGLLVPSFARGAGAEDMNLVLWRWQKTDGVELELIDDDNRLTPG